jgi:hypothetical protein
MKLQKAMKLYEIEVIPENSVSYEEYRIGNKGIWLTCNGWRGRGWKSFATESEAVAYLIDGAERKALEPVKIIFEHVDVDRNGKDKNTNVTACLNFQPKQAQIAIDTLWRAGYRPNKDKPE